ncbi:MAG TPA: peptide deformylase, partial [Thauera aminoaromatica]|nr:peptide deformylase [Thauera aminoaromatica]
VGLAAPQVHRSLQVAVIEFDLANSRYPQMGSRSLTVFVNPKIIVLDSIKQGYWEGCLSVPGLKGYVERPGKVRVEYLDRDGRGPYAATGCKPSLTIP